MKLRQCGRLEYRKKGINFVLAVNASLSVFVFIVYVCITPYLAALNRLFSGKSKRRVYFRSADTVFSPLLCSQFSVVVHTKLVSIRGGGNNGWWFYTFNRIDSKWIFNKNEIAILEIIHFADDSVVTVFPVSACTFRRLRFVHALFIAPHRFRATATWHI